MKLKTIARWRKSSYSATMECVVVAEVDNRMALRNSNTSEGPTLMFTTSGLATWIAGIKAGEFDDLQSFM